MTEEKKEQTHRSGFVNIVGNPNVGKSTLMNLLVGERVSIITSKAQTTRHRIMGIVNTPELQIVYSDTPGVLRPNYKLQESMLEFSESALGDADVLLYVTDTVETADKNEFFLERVRGVKCPVLLLINKVDLTTQPELEALVERWHQELPEAEIIPLSALNNFNVQPLKKRIESLIPPSPPYFVRRSSSTIRRRSPTPSKSSSRPLGKRKLVSTSKPSSSSSVIARRGSSSGTRG